MAGGGGSGGGGNGDTYVLRRLPARKLEKACLKLMTKAVLYSKQVTV